MVYGAAAAAGGHAASCVAIFNPWGSSWFAAVATPYLWSLLTFSPDLQIIVGPAVAGEAAHRRRLCAVRGLPLHPARAHPGGAQPLPVAARRRSCGGIGRARPGTGHSARRRLNGRLAMSDQGRALTVLAVNTVAFTVCFAAWMMNGVLVTFLVDHGVFAWDKAQMGWLIGIPVLTGSLSRLPLGMLTDRYGGRIGVRRSCCSRRRCPCTWSATPTPTRTSSGASLGFGLSGGSFAVGIAYTSVWFSRNRQGTALGIFGAGNAGVGAHQHGRARAAGPADAQSRGARRAGAAAAHLRGGAGGHRRSCSSCSRTRSWPTRATS